MALIECPECRHQVSDQATACPNCGFPLEQTATPAAPAFSEPMPAGIPSPPPQPPRLIEPDVVEFVGDGRFAHEPSWRRVIVRWEPARAVMAIGDGRHSMLPATHIDDMAIAGDGLGAYQIERHRGNAKPIEFRPDNNVEFGGIAPMTQVMAPIGTGGAIEPPHAPPVWERRPQYVSSGYTKTVAGFVFATAAGFGLTAALYLAAGGEYADYIADPAADIEEFATSAAADGVWLLSWLGMLVAGVLFMIWFNQAYKAASSRGPTRTRWGSGWAVGGWFIPFANLVIPKLVMNEVDRISHQDNGEPPIGEVWMERPRLTASDLWWASWVLGGIAAGAESFMISSGTNDAVVLYAAVGAGLYAAAGGLLGFVVLTIGGRLAES